MGVALRADRRVVSSLRDQRDESDELIAQS
jgi:hypothetical protein